MSDEVSYFAFLQKATKPVSASESSTEATDLIDGPAKAQHTLLPLINNKLSRLTQKTLTTETDSDFHAVFISSSVLPSWSTNADVFPTAADLETQVNGGRNGRMSTIAEWDTRGKYSSIIKVVIDVSFRREVKIYTIQGHGGRFEVFIVARMDDGLVGVKANGVET